MEYYIIKIGSSDFLKEAYHDADLETYIRATSTLEEEAKRYLTEDDAIDIATNACQNTSWSIIKVSHEVVLTSED